MGHLINLLAATQSFLSGRMPSGRFQMREKYLLPRFNADRPDPLPSSAATATVSAQAPAAQQPALPTQTQSGMKATANLLRLFGGRPLKTPEPQVTRFANVKVVRNDLEDSDILVAPRGQAASFLEEQEQARSRRQVDVHEQLTQAAARLREKIGI
ncbi:MAG TPA: hypothetical protein VEH27_01275 [Methylomirabilota bacterium]|nr:hypothetical protein [Methylomirabilota bacterium]